MDAGDGVSHIVPVYLGYSIPFAVHRLDVAGRDLTEFLNRLLREAGHLFETSAEQDIVREIKEKLCYVAKKEDREEKLAKVSYELPDGSLIFLTSERHRCPEALFQPGILGKEAKGIHEIIFESVQQCDVDLRRELFGSVFLSGGTTMFPGMEERMQSELSALVQAGVKVKVIAPKDRKYAVWIGGATLSSLSTFKKMTVSREEFLDLGPAVVHTKCF